MPGKALPVFERGVSDCLLALVARVSVTLVVIGCVVAAAVTKGDVVNDFCVFAVEGNLVMEAVFALVSAAAAVATDVVDAAVTVVAVSVMAAVVATVVARVVLVAFVTVVKAVVGTRVALISHTYFLLLPQ